MSSKKRKAKRAPKKVSVKELQKHMIRLTLMKAIEDNPELLDCPDFQELLKEHGATLITTHCDSREEAMEAIMARIAEHPDCFLTESAEQLFHNN
jgi:hypothetical protein